VELVRGGHIGGLRAAVCSFGYSLLNRRNIRNILEYGGGGLMDIGCYPIHVTRLVFGEEPRRVAATIVRDADMGTDILTSAILEFPSGHGTFTCSTQIVGNQTVQFLGTKGKIDLEIPFNAVPDAVSRIRIDDGSDVRGSGVRVEEFAPADQYTLQGDLFARAVYEHTPPPVPLEDSLRNMAVIDAVFRAAETGRWEEPLA
jgi:predicted dehydrogenase